jgi:dTDP-4-dehydrorhamnose 3,5-epimerase
MKIIDSKIIPGVKTITLPVYKDHRGFFTETFNPKVEDVLGVKFVQDNQSSSRKYVVRGIHFQWNEPMGKLVRVAHGNGIDIAVDLRKDSATYGFWHAEGLSANNNTQLWVPPGFGHAFLSLEDNTHLMYKCTAVHNPLAESAISPFDDEIGLNDVWKHFAEGKENIILSDKDRAAGSFADYKLNPKF